MVPMSSTRSYPRIEIRSAVVWERTVSQGDGATDVDELDPFTWLMPLPTT
jgi:hypothetical protein